MPQCRRTTQEEKGAEAALRAASMLAMSLISIEAMERATDELLETGREVGADSWQERAKSQIPHCKFGEQGICCRICAMGPCRITPKSPRGICGCDASAIVARNYLRFTTGGGVQTPGFMGHGKHFIASKKFMKGEGGLGRIVWMPKALKESVAERINQSAKELYDIDDFCDLIADETIAEDPETLLTYLTQNGHPVFEMAPLI